MGQESDYKTQLVLDICSISKRSILCVHTIFSNIPFIDWYCILGVEENAGVNTIRKKYHKLALQLHPDKNEHPKAEIAFKLVCEAYTCLSDATKRKAFNLERQKSFCIKCNKIPYTTTIVPSNSNGSNGSSFKAWNIISKSISSKVRRNIRDMRERFKEEAKVIENCLRTTNSVSKKDSQNRVEKESPVFNPSNYKYQNYPHPRNKVYKNSKTFWYLQTENMGHKDKGDAKAKYTSPIFEVKSSSMDTRKFACVSS
ncbi:dnaJ-related protein rsp1-like [Trifolium pratense]|uniref:Uncharacterized protein n=1 Tax=Trifolium pratense TaxID=57577 RepID=A0ACB0KYQ5_TRIPR|nr:dnaJ-related protein rsp1-like [Trifolium pratense]XP_045788715.1 dnaJ-related protein rsp1-like [Trifolium pratense]CAJ2662293.1 unnamed protein product [Trifolium pratense]